MDAMASGGLRTIRVRQYSSERLSYFRIGSTVREVAAALHISKTEAGRMRLRATEEGLLEPRNGTERAVTNGHVAISMEA